MNGSRELRARTFCLDGGEYLVLSFRVQSAPDIGLTRAEWDVARAVLGGATNAEIATERRRSVNTVVKQVASVFRKLGVCSRLELCTALSGHALGDVECSR